MRRGINLRKKKRKIIEENNKKAIQCITLFTIILILCAIIGTSFLRDFFAKRNFEKESILFSNLNEEIPFSIDKIILFSSATATTNEMNQSILSLDISEYCDIGIYLNNTAKENTSIQSLWIDHIAFSTPELGTPCLYKKTVKDLGKCSFNEENILQDYFAFNLIDTNAEINYDNYEIYQDGSTPISLGFYNKDIKKDFLIDDTEIQYNGTLLRRASIPQSSLNCNVSFCIHLVTNLEEHYLCNISFDVPLEDADGRIYDTGYVTKEINQQEISKFIRIQ